MIEFISHQPPTASSAATIKDYRLHEPLCCWMTMAWVALMFNLPIDLPILVHAPYGWPVQPGTTGRG